jgi:hypothetical protein
MIRHKTSTYTGQIRRAITKAGNPRFPTAAALVRAKVPLSGICGRQSGTGAGFLRLFRFPMSYPFHQMLHIHHLLSGPGTVGQLMADVDSISPHFTKLKKNYTGQIIHRKSQIGVHASSGVRSNDLVYTSLSSLNLAGYI